MESCKPDDAIYEDVSIIVSGALQMSRLLVSIMDWTKISVGQLEIKCDKVNVATVLRHLVRQDFSGGIVHFLSLIMPLFPLCFNVLILIEHCQAERACRMHSQRTRSHEDFSVTLSVSQMVPYAVMVDQRLLEKMLSNGVSNAVKVRD
jgi:hypothetical protein